MLRLCFLALLLFVALMPRAMRETGAYLFSFAIIAAAVPNAKIAAVDRFIVPASSRLAIQPVPLRARE